MMLLYLGAEYNNNHIGGIELRRNENRRRGYATPRAVNCQQVKELHKVVCVLLEYTITVGG